MTTGAQIQIPNRWDESASVNSSEQELLLYRSRILGSDRRVTNYGGGNTSAKISTDDPLTGQPVEVLWVKGSGGDLATLTFNGFATLYEEKVRGLAATSRGLEDEDAMMEKLRYCVFGINPTAPSIDTFLHAFLPHRHVDHLHCDAILAIAAAAHGEALTQKIFGGEVGWIPWQRPGFDLGRKVAEWFAGNPQAKGVILGSHGLVTWGETSRQCYETSLAVINQAAAALAEAQSRPAFGGAVMAPEESELRRFRASALMPRLRGKLSERDRKIGHFDDSEPVLDFVGSRRLRELAEKGTACPDHFLRTKIRPLVLEREEDLNVAVNQYCRRYTESYERLRDETTPPMRDPSPVVVLVPGLGIFTFARDKAMARQAAEYYINAIDVMRGACSLSEYVGLPEAEAFGIEYWKLEDAKLRRLPKEKELARRVALITGAAGGIGRAVAARLLSAGACVVATDIDRGSLDHVVEELAADFGADNVRAVPLDVTREKSVVEACRAAALEYGGLDILVACAGVASSAPYEDTSLELWKSNMDVLATGYFLVSREAFRLQKSQG
ncbi:MAG TPA: bifunctional rhamnulose-1-phosphate aldolase/short-chain dehydrogenase, partial [Thermoanaerobaculia bacterium]|nr:bifunctional rhamnulose-1-phosphate aldolase/short-chain dehydrogenase [Thermoanaerobaculia bacterium]